MCDYLASRKSINLFFDKDNNIVDELPKEIIGILESKNSDK